MGETRGLMRSPLKVGGYYRIWSIITRVHVHAQVGTAPEHFMYQKLGRPVTALCIWLSKRQFMHSAHAVRVGMPVTA